MTNLVRAPSVFHLTMSIEQVHIFFYSRLPIEHNGIAILHVGIRTNSSFYPHK